MKYKIFGCKVNKYFTDKRLKSEYLKNKEGVFIATCVVTDKAKKKWIKFVKESAKELRKGEKIYISGCGDIDKGEVQSDFYELYPELEEFNERIELLGEEPTPLNPPLLRGGINHPSPLTPLLPKGEGKETTKQKEFGLLPLLQKKRVGVRYTKKFLLIQGGCDSFCSFCLTVLKRGKHFFRDKDDIVNEILEFENAGGKEIVLTGVNLGAWGSQNTNDIKDSCLAELLEYILRKTNIPRIKISSLGPEFVNDKCLEIFKNKRILPHFHYSVQSGSSEVLKSMKRHYDGKYIRNLLEKTKNLKRDDNVEVSVGADLLVGFPGENEEDFAETYNLVKDGLITKCHIFPFSNHKIGETVPASKFPNQISEKIKKERVKRLEEIGNKVRQDFIKGNQKCHSDECQNQQNVKNSLLEVLIEVVKNEDGKLKWKGWTENYIEANENNFKIISGEIKRNNIIKGLMIVES